MPQELRTGLVITAHPGDFVWRAGGAIALYARRGYRMKIACLSLGERGESQFAWRKPGARLEEVRAQRREEADRAAAVLGAEIEHFGLPDYPLRGSPELLERLVDIYRELRPEFVLTHALKDPYNFDHPLAAHLAQEARIVAQAMGHKPEQYTEYKAPPVYLFEPHQPEQCEFRPDILLKIDEVWETKVKAFEVLAAQKHLWDYYTRVALNRGIQGSRNSGRPMNYCEAYQRLFPTVTEDFS